MLWETSGVQCDKHRFAADPRERACLFTRWVCENLCNVRLTFAYEQEAVSNSLLGLWCDRFRYPMSEIRVHLDQMETVPQNALRLVPEPRILESSFLPSEQAALASLNDGLTRNVFESFRNLEASSGTIVLLINCRSKCRYFRAEKGRRDSTETHLGESRNATLDQCRSCKTIQYIFEGF